MSKKVRLKYKIGEGFIMSREQVRDFFKKVETDEVLQQKLEILDKDTSDVKICEASVVKIVDIAKSAGYIFSTQEFIDVVTQNQLKVKQKSTEPPPPPESCTLNYACHTWDEDCYVLYK